MNILWIPSHIGHAGNERADHLAVSTKFSTHSFIFKIPATDLLTIHCKLLRNAWQSTWSSLSHNFTSCHRQNILASIISRRLIVWFNRLCFGHSLLPQHSFKLFLNSSPHCTSSHKDSIGDFNRIIFNCPSLLPSRQLLFSLVSSFGYITPDSIILLNLRSISIIHSIINIIHSSGYLI